MNNDQLIIQKLESIEKKQDYTNGKVKQHDLYIAEVKGGKAVLKWIWSAVFVFITAGIFGLFQMNEQVIRLEQVVVDIQDNIDKQIKYEVSTYFEQLQ